jgi:hypothetical protein
MALSPATNKEEEEEEEEVIPLIFVRKTNTFFVFVLFESIYY